MSESLGSVRTVLAFNAADRAAEEYNEVRPTTPLSSDHPLVTWCALWALRHSIIVTPDTQIGICKRCKSQCSCYLMQDMDLSMFPMHLLKT